jgi:hypothetical protein
VEEASQADDGSRQNVEDWGQCTRDWENWTVYFRHVQYDNGDVNSQESDIFQAIIVLH